MECKEHKEGLSRENSAHSTLAINLQYYYTHQIKKKNKIKVPVEKQNNVYISCDIVHD